MTKCGKGCMPECEYFTTGGCISQFNCMYKIEGISFNSATSISDTYVQSLIAELERLKAENAALRERLERAVELPFVPTDYHIEAWLSEIKVSLTDESATIVVPVYIYQKFDNSEAAEARLAELKGEKE